MIEIQEGIVSVDCVCENEEPTATEPQDLASSSHVYLFLSSELITNYSYEHGRD